VVSIGVVGLGNIGLRTAWLLAGKGYNVIGVDSRMSAVRKAESMGLEAKLLDALSLEALRTLASKVDAVALALPSSISYKALLNLATLGVDVVDVSFFRGDLGEIELEARNTGSRVIVYAGFSPGLSNVLVARGVKMVGGKRARVYSGGISEDPGSPLGLSATWNTEDLVEEYVRPARLIRGGALHVVDPLEGPVEKVEVSDVGTLECFYTDGLGSLLQTFNHLEELAECTLRWPGHVAIMRELKSLSMLAREPVEVSGCPVYPASFLAELLKRVSAKNRDIALLKVVVEGDLGSVRFESIVKSTENWSATSIAVGSVQAAMVSAMLSGLAPGDGGIIYPELFGEDEKAYSTLIGLIREWGVPVEETALTQEPV